MKYLMIFGLTALYAACGAVQQDGKTTVVGKITGAEGQLVTFQNNSLRGHVDSTYVSEEGTFAISVNNMPLDFYKLSVGDQSMLLIMDSTQKVMLNGEYENLRSNYQVKGSKDSELLAGQTHRDIKFRASKDSLDNWARSLGPNPSDSDRKKYETAANGMIQEYYDYLIAFLDENPKSPACISISHNLHPIQEIERLKKIKENLKDVIPMSNAFLSLKKKIADSERKAIELKAQQSAAKASGVGNEAPEINLPDPDGSNVALSSLKGKYVLVDFWASWCGPCRRENPNVVKLYEKYKSDGFEVYGVSLDSSKDRWVNAIAQDNLSWIHVSDLSKWESVAAKAYGVRSIPHTVLLDKEGKIMSVKLRGASLEAKLKEIFGH